MCLSLFRQTPSVVIVVSAVVFFFIMKNMWLYIYDFGGVYYIFREELSMNWRVDKRFNSIIIEIHHTIQSVVQNKYGPLI